MPDFQHDLAALDRVFNQPLPKVQGPDDWAQARAATTQADAQAREARAKAQAAEEARADEVLIRQIGQETGGDPEQMVVRLRAVNPRVGMKFSADLENVRKTQIDRAKAEHEQEMAVLDENLGLVQLARSRPDLWPQLRARVVTNDPEMEALLPEEWDDTKIDPVWQIGMTAKEIAAREAKSLEYLMKGDYMQAAAQGLSNPTMNAQEYEAAKAGLIQNGVPRAIVDRFPPWSPDAWQIALEMGMTPDQRTDNARQSAAQEETARHHGVLEQQGAERVAQGAERVQIARGTAQRLASQAAGTATGGGRGVTSGDANRIADYDTSLDDLGEVREVLTGPGSTGAVSAAGAWVPNVVTEMTGWGAGAKQRQAVIDRVKQVIGKALEGGVLRKEDEYKYEKILPTISDAPALVASKLHGLEAAIRQRRSTLIDSLGDAGYNVSAYQRRPTRRAPGGTETTQTTGGGSAKPRFKFDPKTGALVEQK